MASFKLVNNTDGMLSLSTGAGINPRSSIIAFNITEELLKLQRRNALSIIKIDPVEGDDEFKDYPTTDTSEGEANGLPVELDPLILKLTGNSLTLVDGSALSAQNKTSIRQSLEIADVLQLTGGSITKGTSAITEADRSALSSSLSSAPAVFTTRALTSADNNKLFTCTAAQVVTIPSGLPAGFSVSFDGPVNFTAGAGVMVSLDDRLPGSLSPFCVVFPTSVADSYKVRGTKV